MIQFRIYRHPKRGLAAVKDDSWLARLRRQEDRLTAAGYQYSGMVVASSEEAAMAQWVPEEGEAPYSHPPTPAKPAFSPVMIGSGVLVLVALAAGVASYLKRHKAEVEPPPEAAYVPPAPESVLSPEGFTPWMSYSRTTEFDHKLDTNKFRVVAVEGRAEGGGQCRAKLEPAPDSQHWTYWWCARTAEDFGRLSTQYVLAGYRLVQEQKYTDAQGRDWHSGVWHKEAK